MLLVRGHRTLAIVLGYRVLFFSLFVAKFASFVSQGPSYVCHGESGFGDGLLEGS